ncbi:hypothetical protein AAG570_010467 [Ranatra chinensis]|uniref:Transmembrane protein n=1 Tax=Ranatra chinensis TaxID=642074 RepID=A0ABD0YMR2_9HEMI
MLGNERQRAYRYGMTLLCVGVFFNWLSITENNSEPVRFVGFTCLASGALLVCMAICLWANSTRHANAQIRPERSDSTENDTDSIREPSHATEKPPDYDSVADTSPPPSYADAILLNPSILVDRQEGEASSNATASGVTENSTSITIEPAPEPDKLSISTQPEPEPSRLSRVLRLSRRFIRRTVSNIDRSHPSSPSMPHLSRSISTQDHKPA